MTTRDEYEKRKRRAQKSQHLRVYQGLSERPARKGKREMQAPKVTQGRRGQWDRRALLALQVLLWSLCSFALTGGLLRILAHFRK